MNVLLHLLLFAQIINTGGYRKVFPSGGGTTPASWDTTAGTTCNPLITVSAMSYTCNLTNVSAGSIIVIGYFGQNTALSSLTVDGVAATVLVDQALVGGFGRQGVYIAVNAASGSHTVVLNYPTVVTPPGLFVKTIIGATTTSPIDGTPIGTPYNAVSAISCGAFTTSTTNTFVAAWGMAGGTTPLVAGAGFTLISGVNLNSGNTGGFWETMTGTTAGSYNPNFTNGSGHTGCIGFAIKHL